MINLSSYVTFIKSHERILIIAVTGFLIFHIGDGALNAWIHHDDTQAKIAATTVKTDTTQTAALQVQVTTLQKQVDATNAALIVAIKARNTATQAQQTIDQTLPLPALAVRWEELAQLQPADIKTTATNDLLVTESASRATVVLLEELPTLQANLKSDQTIIDNDVLIISKQSDLITQLNKDLADEKASHVADVKLEQAKGKRSFWRGFKIGAVVGFIGGVWLGHTI